MLVTAKDPLVYPHPTAPGPGEVVEVAPGILWLRLELPFLLNHVNIYLLADGDGWAMVDTGLDTEQSKATWRLLLKGPLAGTKFTRLIVTHSHPDHVGLAGALAGRFKCPLVMTQMEYYQALYFQTRRTEVQLQDQVNYYSRHGIGEEAIDSLIGSGSHYLTLTSILPPSFISVRDGDTLSVGERKLDVLTGGGHASDQMMLLSRADKIFLSADQVLSKISPNVSVWSMEPDANALGHYITSLRRLARDIPDDVLVLPGHGVPFYGVQTRIQQLLDHHVERCAAIAQATREKALTAWEMVPLIFHRPLDAHQAGFATGEVVAHINYMLSRGELTKETRPDGIMRFKAA